MAGNTKANVKVYKARKRPETTLEVHQNLKKTKKNLFQYLSQSRAIPVLGVSGWGQIYDRDFLVGSPWLWLGFPAEVTDSSRDFRQEFRREFSCETKQE